MEEADEEVLLDRTSLLNDIRKQKNDSSRCRCGKTLALCGGFLGLGMAVSLFGPTLLEFGHKSDTNLDHISWVFSSRALGHLGGSLLGGYFLDRFNGSFLLGICLLLLGVGFVILPWLSSFAILLGFVAMLGLCMGTIDKGSNVLLVRLWKKQNAPYVQLNHLLFGLGAFIAPLLLTPFTTGASMETAMRMISTNSNETMVTPLHLLPSPPSYRQPRSKRDIADDVERILHSTDIIPTDFLLSGSGGSSLAAAPTSAGSVEASLAASPAPTDAGSVESTVTSSTDSSLPSDTTTEPSTTTKKAVKPKPSANDGSLLRQEFQMKKPTAGQSQPEGGHPAAAPSCESKCETIAHCVIDDKAVTCPGDELCGQIARLNETHSAYSNATIACPEEQRCTNPCSPSSSSSSSSTVTSPAAGPGCLQTCLSEVVCQSANASFYCDLKNSSEICQQIIKDGSSVFVSTAASTEPVNFSCAKVNSNESLCQMRCASEGSTSTTGTVTSSLPTTSTPSTTTTTTTTTTSTTSSTSTPTTTSTTTTPTTTTTTTPTTTTSTTPTTTTSSTSTSTSTSTTSSTTSTAPATSTAPTTSPAANTAAPPNSSHAHNDTVAATHPPWESMVNIIESLSQMQFAFSAVGIFIVSTSLIFFLFICSDYRLLGPGRSDAAGVKQAKGDLRNGERSYRRQLLVLLFLFHMLYVGVEAAFGGLVASFSATSASLNFKQPKAALLTAAFWGLFAVGRLIGIPVARFVNSAVILGVSLTISTVASLTLATQSELDATALWVATGTLGLGLSVVLPAATLWASSKIHMEGTSTLVVGAAVGGIVAPAVVGALMEHVGPHMLMWSAVAMTAAADVVFACLLVLACRHKFTYERLPSGVQDYEEDSPDEDNCGESKSSVSLSPLGGTQARARSSERVAKGALP